MSTKPMKPITPQQVQDVEGLLQTLKDKAQTAHQAGDIYMNSIYAELVKVVSPITTRAHARMHREDRARINKGVKELRRADQKGAPRANKNASGARDTSAPEKASSPTA
ncbi:MAG TPA: hypothetical protein VGD98_09805 [Ktedonobacteraceae bacterium]